MPVVCPRCSKLYEPGAACPRCGAPVPVTSSADAHGHGPRWQQTTWGRILIGMVLAQGLFYGLRHLFTGVLLTFRDPGDLDLWADPRNVFLLHSILSFAVFIGGMLAGGGQHYGLVLGALTGVWNGVMAALLKQHPAGEIAGLGFLSLPLLQAGFGAVGGLIGSIIWKPISAMGTIGDMAGDKKKIAARKKAPLLAGPIAWVRVLLGSAGVVAGSLFAAKLVHKVLDLGGNVLGTTDDFQDVLIIWEFKACLILLGAGFAGMSTKNGFKQGLIVGIIASSVLIGVQAPVTKNLIEMVLFTVVITLGLCLVGGWFGGQLLPPVFRANRRAATDGAPSW